MFFSLFIFFFSFLSKSFLFCYMAAFVVSCQCLARLFLFSGLFRYLFVYILVDWTLFISIWIGFFEWFVSLGNISFELHHFELLLVCCWMTKINFLLIDWFRCYNWMYRLFQFIFVLRCLSHIGCQILLFGSNLDIRWFVASSFWSLTCNFSFHSLLGCWKCRKQLKFWMLKIVFVFHPQLM